MLKNLIIAVILFLVFVCLVIFLPNCKKETDNSFQGYWNDSVVYGGKYKVDTMTTGDTISYDTLTYGGKLSSDTLLIGVKLKAIMKEKVLKVLSKDISEDEKIDEIIYRIIMEVNRVRYGGKI